MAEFDPRDPRSRQQSGNDAAPDDTGNRLPVSDNPYVFDDTEGMLWGATNMDTCIARAWSRARRGGHYVGKPLDAEYDLDKTTVAQDFQFATARFTRNDNPNQMVEFSDGRGPIASESGL